METPEPQWPQWDARHSCRGVPVTFQTESKKKIKILKSENKSWCKNLTGLKVHKIY